MTVRLFNPPAIGAAVKHYFTGTYIAVYVNLPENRCTGPVFGAANLIFLNQADSVARTKHACQKPGEIVFVVPALRAQHYAFGYGAEEFRWSVHFDAVVFAGRPYAGVVFKIVARRVVVAAVVLPVAFANVVSEVLAGLIVYVPGKSIAPVFASRTHVTGVFSFVRFEGVSVVHWLGGSMVGWFNGEWLSG